MNAFELAALIQASAPNSTAILSPGEIPKSVIAFGWNLAGVDLYWEEPAGMKALNFHENMEIPKKQKFYCPRMIFRYCDESLYCYAVKGKNTITDKTELFMAPFPNMLSKDESCMGTAAPNKEGIDSLKALIQLWAHGFYYGVFTHNAVERVNKTTLKDYYTKFAHNEKSEKFLKSAEKTFGAWKEENS